MSVPKNSVCTRVQLETSANLYSLTVSQGVPSRKAKQGSAEFLVAIVTRGRTCQQRSIGW